MCRGCGGEYLYDTRYAGESGELVGSGFTGCWCHQTEEGGLQDTTEDSITPGRIETLDCVSYISHISFWCFSQREERLLGSTLFLFLCIWDTQCSRTNNTWRWKSFRITTWKPVGDVDVPYPRRGNRWEQREHLQISWHRSPRLWAPWTWAPAAALCIWRAWPWATPDGTQWLEKLMREKENADTRCFKS